MGITSALLEAKVAHKRFHPKENSFVYKQYYAFLKASKKLEKPSLLFGINRFNLFSFYFKKHGARDGSNPYEYAYDLLMKNCKDISWLKDIYILTQPALLGWSFNPVSFWFYIGENDEIRAVLSEVNNTFGEHHNYFAYHDGFQPIQSNDVLKAQKMFHVSPFLKIEGDYRFRFKMSPQNIWVSINYFINEEKTLTTSLTAKTKPFNNLQLIKLFFKIPAANLKTVFLIHWQALKICLKGIKYVPHKKHKNKKITRCR